MIPSGVDLGICAVLMTVVLGSSVYIQGVFVTRHENGMVTVRVGDRLFTGRPANTEVAA